MKLLIPSQIEFYLSDANIRQDKFVKSLLKDDDGKLQDRRFIGLDVFMKFNRIKQLTNDVEDLKIALSDSPVVELSEDEKSVRRKFPVNNDKDVIGSTIYVEKLPDPVDHDWLSELFSNFGRVDHVSLPKFQENKQIMGFAFIEFDNARSAATACDFFNYLESHRPESASPPKVENESRTIIDKLLDNLSVNEINSMNNRINQRSCPGVNVVAKKERSADAKTAETEMADAETADAETAAAETDGAKSESPVDAKKRSANDALDDEPAKRLKSDKHGDNFSSLLEDLKNRFQSDIGRLTNLRVISKARWMAYKREYLHLKKKLDKKEEARSRGESQMETDATAEQKSRKPKSEKKKEVPEYGSGLIVKLQYGELTKGESMFKSKLRSLAPDQYSIAYIDIRPDSNLVYLRFKEAVTASNYLANDRLAELGQAVLLEGEEEQTYWTHIHQGLMNKKAKHKEKSQKQRELKEQRKKESEMEHESVEQSNEATKSEQAKNQPAKNQPAKTEPNRISNYEKGLIIKLQMDIDLNNEPTEQQLKKRIKSAANNSYIGYIDLDTTVYNLFLSSELIRKTCFIRCKTAELAKKVMDGEEFKALGESSVLEGDEERDYWQRVKECSMRKHQSKKSK